MGARSALPLTHQTVQTQVSTDILHRFGTPPTGLTSGEAAERLLHDGPNSLKSREEGWFTILARQFATPLIGLLVVAGLISFFLGETTDGMTIVGILILNGLLGFVQEFRSSRSLRTLEHYLRRQATVRREGKIVSIDRSNLVRGDLVILTAGDAVPADLRLLRAEELRIDESTLTGESRDVFKTAGPIAKPTPELYESTNLAFSGTLVRHGEGQGIVIAIGEATIVGSLAEIVATTRHVSTFEKNIKDFSTFLMKVVAVSLAIIFTVNLLTKGDSLNVTEQLLFALALAISVVPEALPAVTTITLSRGAFHLARHHVVVKRLSAIEDLGHIDILCTDKTGTLTENRPAVSKFIAGDRTALLHDLLAAIPPSVRAGAREAGDPFDTALLEYARAEGYRIPTNDTLHELPFDPSRRWSGVLIRENAKQRLILRGAPENVLALCGGISHDEGAALIARSEELGRGGERVIATAHRILETAAPKDLGSLAQNLTFVGLVSFVDPIKATSRKALLAAEGLGVEVKIVTGDSAAVAGAVAEKLSIVRSPLEVITGEQLSRLSLAEYRHAIRTYRVFARMTPQQKYDLLKVLSESKSVGFLGEGINDAPALKLATVSLVVDSASDVAREAADIVLLDKSLQVIVDGIRNGRTIYANILKYVKYTLIGNFGNFFAIAGISLLIDFLPMLPVQILLTNLLTDFPLVAVAGDRVDPRELRRPQQFRLRELGFLTLALGIVSSIFDFVFFGIFRHNHPDTIQTLWFVTSILSELLLIYSIRTTLPIHRASPPSPLLTWLTLGASLVTIVLPWTTLGAQVFHFVRPTGMHVATIGIIVLTYFVITEFVKELYYRQYRHHPT